MAKLERGAKSNAVREYIAAHPEAGPTEVVKALAEKNIGVTAALVSNLKAGKKAKKSGTKKSGKTKARKAHRVAAQPSNFTLTLSAYQAVRQFASQHGGYDKARSALAEAEQFETENKG